MRTPFVTTLGVEYTFVAKHPLQERLNEQFDGDEGEFSKAVMGASFALMARDRRLQSFKDLGNFHDEAGGVELNSPPFGDREQASTYTETLYDAVKRVGLLSTRRVDDVGSGGGHVHAGLMKFSDTKQIDIVLTVFRDMLDRPYLNWIFNEYIDDWNANSLTEWLQSNEPRPRRAKAYLLGSELPRFIGEFCLTQYSEVMHIFDMGKHYAMRVNDAYDGHTLEFRVFDAPDTPRIAMLHLDFVDAYMRWATSIKDPFSIMPRRTALKHYNRPRVEREFGDLLTKLGLRQRDYDRFLRTNYADRRKYGALV